MMKLCVFRLLYYNVELILSCFFFFKQKTAYEMRISDWSSDVCSSDLYFDEWMPLATSSQKIFLFCRSQGEYRDAAFNLHQATERLYACLLLTLTYYSPYKDRKSVV